jgi:putative transposase
MPRTARAAVGGMCCHVLNRGNARAEVFHEQDDYAAFLDLLCQAGERVAMRLLAWCVMPNHFHLVLWPRGDDDLGRYMQWLSTSHVRRYHRRYGGSGHVWQGRYKAFPIQHDEHLLTVMRYVERNPVRTKALPIRKAQRWPWSSAGTPPRGVDKPLIDAGPVPRGRDWPARVNQPLTKEELAAVRESVVRGSPFGAAAWRQRTARRLGLEFTLRPRGRPKKSMKK